MRFMGQLKTYHKTVFMVQLRNSWEWSVCIVGFLMEKEGLWHKLINVQRRKDEKCGAQRKESVQS